jgi:hypothetical protein
MNRGHCGLSVTRRAVSEDPQFRRPARGSWLGSRQSPELSEVVEDAVVSIPSISARREGNRGREACTTWFRPREIFDIIFIGMQVNK